MDKFEVSIIEYLGKVDGGILVLLGITYQSKYYESTFYYNEKDILLTISEDLEEITGEIKQYSEYTNILKDILKKVVPFTEMYDRIDDVNFGRWVEGFIQVEEGQAEEIDESEIKKDTE
jgi:hypothetical protein